MVRISSFSQELRDLLPRLAQGEVLPNRHVQMNGSRFVASLSVNEQNFMIIQFSKEDGALSMGDADSLRSAVASVASIGESRGGASLHHMSFRLSAKVC